MWEEESGRSIQQISIQIYKLILILGHDTDSIGLL